MNGTKTLLCVVAIAATMATFEPLGDAAVYNLRAATTTKQLPDGTQVTMWGFGLVGSGPVSVPGPVLEVPPGDTSLTINLTNQLAVPVSIVIPALPAALTPVWNDGTTGPRTNLQQRAVSFTRVAQPGETVTYQWTNVEPGTYLYQSGTHPAVQVPMGLYGAMKHDAVQGQAYGTAYDLDQVLLYSEIDPALIAAVNSGAYGTAAYPTTIGYRARFFLVNGGPGTTPLDVQVNVGQRLLLRVLNAGLETTVPTFTAGTMTLLAEDAQRAPFTRDSYAMLLPAGKTRDALFAMTDPGTTVLFDRRGLSRFARITAVPAPPPVAVADAYTATSGTPLVVPAPGVLGNDTDPGGNPLMAQLVTGPAGGTLMLGADGSFQYSANAGTTQDSFTYSSSNGTAVSSPATVNITVTSAAQNLAPLAMGELVFVRRNTGRKINVIANHVDSDGAIDPASVSLRRNPISGSAQVLGNGIVRYRPKHDFRGLDSFAYVVRDDRGAAPTVTSVLLLVW